MSSASQIARRYAEALADSAEAENALSPIAGDLAAFASLVASSPELQSVFASPIVEPEKKGAVLEALIARAQPLPLVARFLHVLHSNDRLRYLEAVNRAFAREVDRRLGVVMADVTTAEPLGEAEREALAKRLEQMTGKRVKLSFATDEKLIGGVVTRIGSRIYDGSVRAQLDAVKRQMIGRTGA
jgi:F-type H+-transporting ATPase subunit delta